MIEISVEQLILSVPHGIEEIVQKTCDERKARIQHVLRQESRLLKKQKDKDAGDKAKENVNVPVEVKPGLPECLRGFRLPHDDEIAALIASYRMTLRKTKEGLDRVTALVSELNSSSEGLSLLAQRDRHIPPVLSLLDDLIRKGLGIDLVQMIQGINKDVLGAYIFKLPRAAPTRGVKVPRIEIYWQVIGLFADELNVSVEDLTTVVLAHEQSHAYTHLGNDANGHSWETESFDKSELGLVEGLAQYYTEQITDKLHRQYPGVRKAYELLLERQPPAYQTHRAWVSDCTPEAVRIAMLEERRQPQGELQSFNNALRDGNKRLRKNAFLH